VVTNKSPHCFLLAPRCCGYNSGARIGMGQPYRTFPSRTGLTNPLSPHLKSGVLRLSKIESSGGNMTASLQAPRPRAQRFQLRFPLSYRKIGMPDWKNGTTINISRTGILFEAGEDIPQDSVLDVRVCMPLKATLTCEASIVRTEGLVFGARMKHFRISHESNC
jgi:hypothetical protein